MNSADDTPVVTPADTSNFSSPESTSSEFSQPTIKLRAGKEQSKNRKIDHDPKPIFAADGHDPFLQSLDKDGCYLIETTGRTAQRTRASIRDNCSRYNDQMFPKPDHPETSKDHQGHWPNCYYQPRKCRSATSANSQEKNANRRVKKRHSCGVSSSRRSWDKPESKETLKRYSAGDYLRQQILDDLNSNDIIGKTDEQIAEDRYKRVKAYLRRRSDDSEYVPPETRLKELRDWSKIGGKHDKDSSDSTKAKKRKDLDRVKTFLQEKIRLKMNAEETRRAEIKRWSTECPKELSVEDIRSRYPNYNRVEDRVNYPTRRVRSDANIRIEYSSSDSEKDHEKLATGPFPSRKESRKKGNVCRRTRSDIVPETIIDFDDNEVKTRFYSYSAGRRNSWKTKSGLTFEKKLSLPNKMRMNVDCESGASSTDYKRNDWRYPKKSLDEDKDSRRDAKKYCRRTRSDTVTDKSIGKAFGGRRAKQRSVSWSDKRKLHRGTSVRSAGLVDTTSVDSEMDSVSPRLRKSRQKSSPCSWREYKEKRRQDQLCREMANTGSDPRFRAAAPKTLVESLTSLDNENVEQPQDRKCSDQFATDLFTNYYKAADDDDDDATNTNENCVEFTRSGGDNANDTETETILQENYLLLEREEPGNYRSPTISRLQVNQYRDQSKGDWLASRSNAPDIGYHSISSRGWDQGQEKSGLIKFNANSNVKKSDTFKIVDGSEKTIDDDLSQKEMWMCNLDTRRGPVPWNDSMGSSFGSTVVSNCDDAADDTETPGSAAAMDQHFEGRSKLDPQTSDDDLVARSNKDIADDYFRRVYGLLKQRQEDARRETPEVFRSPMILHSETSSTTYDDQEDLRKRRRRRKKDKNSQGEDLVAVSPGVREDDNWGVQRLLVNNEPGNLIFRRPQLQNLTGHKRTRHPAPPIPANCKINAKDISKYFDYPNKENSPRNGVDECRQSERNELIEQQQLQVDSNEAAMGSNLSRHSGKGLTGRRTQSSGDLCDPKGKINQVGKILVPCSSAQRERYKICGSLPNHLDNNEILNDDDPGENNNVISDTIIGKLGGTFPRKKRSLGVHFSDASPTGALDLVKHQSQDSLEGDPWRYQEGVDPDLVRSKHGNLDVVRRNQSVDVVDGDSSSSGSKTYGTIGRSSGGRCYRGADLDLVGTLPKRRPGESKGESSGPAFRQTLEGRQNPSLDRKDGDLLIKVMHKPDCELMKQHHQLDRVVDLKLSRLAGGEPQDQGYASERSPEEEHPPSLPGQPFPKVTAENTFRVSLQKSSRGLGLSVSGGGTAGPVRVKRLFPQQPAALSKKLQSGDILLAANGVPLTGLTNYEALEVLRTTPSTVELVVCRVPGDTTVTSPGAPPPPPARREPPSSLRILNPQPPLQIEPCGEFDIEMTKVAGSLGFTLRKVDSSALGHYVRALVREPALSDGRIQPGDKIVSVDGEPLSPMSHEEAVALLRQCGPRVKLRLYRDLAQTPVSALSPTEPDHPLRPPRTSLRQEAVDMLCDLAVRKLSPDTSNSSSNQKSSVASCHSPRRLRKPLSRTPTAENNNENHLSFHPVNSPVMNEADASDTDQCSINTQATNSQSETGANDIIEPPPFYDVCESSDSSKTLLRPSFLDLSARPEKPHFEFSLESESDYTGPIIVTESDSNLTVECDYDDDLEKDAPAALSSDEIDNNLPLEPASMPPVIEPSTRTTSAAFSYKNPAYQSANPTCCGIDNIDTTAKNKTAHSSDHDIPGKVLGAEDPAGSKGLLKWKGVMFAPNDGVSETNGKEGTEEPEKESNTQVGTRNVVSEDGNEVLTVELTRGWNSRLGFSLQAEGTSTVISVVHPDSVAAKDGRLMEGDILMMVNDESVENMPTAEIIDLLRKIRGSIGITVMRKKKTKNVL